MACLPCLRAAVAEAPGSMAAAGRRKAMRASAPLTPEGRPRTLAARRGRLTAGGGRAGEGGVRGRGSGFRHCQAHIRVSDPQVGCSQDGAPHLWRESARSKHTRGSFLPRHASRYTASLRGPGLLPRRRGRGSAGHLRPYEAGQLAGDRHHRDAGRLAAGGHLGVLGVQPLLRLPGPGQRLRRQAGLPAPEGGPDRRPVPVGPRHLDQGGRTPSGPALVMWPRRVRDPLEYSVGISPAKPMNARAEANRRQSTTSAASVRPVSWAIPR